MDFKVNISEESQPAPNTKTIEPAEKSSQVPTGSERQGRRTELSKPRTEPGSPTPARTTGPEHKRGFHTILDSVEKEPLKLWQTEVSVYKTLNSL